MTRRRFAVVVEHPADAAALPPELVVSAERYLEGSGELREAGATVLNLCRSFRYGTAGYYVSLLAEARGHKVVPSVETSEGMGEPYGLFRALQEAGVATVDAAEMRVRRRAHPAPEAASQPLVRTADGSVRPAAPAETAETLALLGESTDLRFRAAARAVYREWPAPLLRVRLLREGGRWKVCGVAPESPHRLEPAERAALAALLADRRRIVRRTTAPQRPTRRASIAVLASPDDPFSPSGPETIDRLQRVAERMNVHVHTIGPGDLRKLPEYDALFIRALTGVAEPAFQFALRAEALDMPVIDDTQSIIRCSNKVFLEELLRREGVPTPRTRIVTPSTPWTQVAELGLPLVLKLPDGSFSAAVHRVDDRAAFRRHAGEMFRHSPLLIAQEWLPTEFDWRITVLGGRVLFAARYFMARGHWQIRHETAGGGERYGRVEAVARAEAPAEVVAAALRAAALIGDGLYGVDLKETPEGPVVIEINDNPNLDAGYEDGADGTEIYRDLVQYFLDRIEEQPADEAPPPARPRGRTRAAPRPFQLLGMELEYPVVDESLEVVPRVEALLRAAAGRPTSDTRLGRAGLSNEIADHVLEIKTPTPVTTLREAETILHDGVARASALLRQRWGARLLPTGMHPFFDPAAGRLWRRSNARIYGTYARLFDVRTHGWMNVHASHLNLPMGTEADAMALHTAAALLIPYLPALAASSPMHDGRLQPDVDARLAWIVRHQARVPESCGEIVPEYVGSLREYRERILQPMFAALDGLPDAGAIRRDFFNARGAVFKFGRRALELRVLDTQECVRMDVAVAAFARAALRHLSRRLRAGRIRLPAHPGLVADFHACLAHGCEARVAAPHLEVARASDGSASARDALRALLEGARRSARADEEPYLELAGRIVHTGSLGERIRAALHPFAGDAPALHRAARRVYTELAECLDANEPWRGRGLQEP